MANLTATATYFSPNAKFFIEGCDDQAPREAVVMMVKPSTLEDDLSHLALFVYERDTGAVLFAQLVRAHWEIFVCDCCMEVQWSINPDDEVFYGLDFEEETDIACFIEAFDNATTLATSSMSVEGSMLLRPLDHAEVLNLLAEKSVEIFPEANKTAATYIPTLLFKTMQWFSDAWRHLW